MDTVAVLWSEVFRPLMMLALVVAAISVVTWHFSRPKPNTCPWCASRVHHSHDEPIETETK